MRKPKTQNWQQSGNTMLLQIYWLTIVARMTAVANNKTLQKGFGVHMSSLKVKEKQNGENEEWVPWYKPIFFVYDDRIAFLLAFTIPDFKFMLMYALDLEQEIIFKKFRIVTLQRIMNKKIEDVVKDIEVDSFGNIDQRDIPESLKPAAFDFLSKDSDFYEIVKNALESLQTSM